MYPILILRCEAVCLLILVFLHLMSHSYNVNKESKAFTRIMNFAILHVIFDFITVLTVNNTASVPEWLNWLCHVIFYLSAIFYSNELVNYVITICYPTNARRLYGLGHLLIAIYICCLSFLDIYYLPDIGTYSSGGPAAIAGYGLAFLFFASALVVIFTHMKRMTNSIKIALIPMMLVLMIAEICQVIWPSVLFTGAAITIITVGFFFSLENPVAVFKQKAMTDALTGVRSRSSYEEDIEKYNQRFQSHKTDDYIFVFIDLNDLRNVNNRYGHAEGDSYITLIATSINRCMKQATTVYRIGGDEFLILYYKVNESIVESEIRALQDTCISASESHQYIAAISAGYAQSSAEYKNLYDVVKTADYAMYQNKEKFKNGKLHSNTYFGSKLNYTGLTDKIFEVMCASNNANYPFITNTETNVTRISPGWKEYFGLESEFYFDFSSVWKDRIHPDYFAGYMDDIVAVTNGHRRYHNYDYLARRADGAYVDVSCHGSMYTDVTSGITYFTGYMVNHTLENKE